MLTVWCSVTIQKTDVEPQAPNKEGLQASLCRKDARARAAGPENPLTHICTSKYMPAQAERKGLGWTRTKLLTTSIYEKLGKEWNEREI